MTAPLVPDSDLEDAGAAAHRLLAFAESGLADFATDAAPGLRLPGSYGGHPIADDTRADLLYVMGLLIEAGVSQVAGADLRSRVLGLLDEVVAADVEGFYSYRIAETVLRLGGISALPADRVQVVRTAARSPRLIADLMDPSSQRRTNFLVVGARCLWALAALDGREPAELRPILRRVADLFASSATGWINDAHAPLTQYDIYTPDMYLLAEPFAACLGPAWRTGLAKVITDLDALAQPGGAIVWGRSVGVLSLAMTVEAGAICAERSIGDRADRWLTRIHAATAEMRQWFRDGVITAHLGRTSDSYRGASRRLQMTLDVYGKLLLAARSLRRCPAHTAPCSPSSAWPPADSLITFDERSRSAAWAYRSRDMSFVLPVMHGYSADYLPSPRQPLVFEQPAAGPPALIPAVHARVCVDGRSQSIPLIPAGAARTVRHEEQGLLIEHDGWAPIGSGRDDAHAIGGSRSASYRVRGRVLEVRERLTFDAGAPGPVVVLVGDSEAQPVRLSAGPEGRLLEIDTTGMAEWQSHWGACSRVQQLEVPAGRSVEFTWRVTRGLRIASTDLDHQYSQALYKPMSGKAAVVSAGLPDPDLAARLRDVDIVHLAWPERWSGVDPAVNARVIGQVRAAGARIAWTQHNLVPHRSKDADGFATYALWAQAADLVIHHSEYGRRTALATHRYGARTRHVVISHGAWSEHYRAYGSVTREEVEREEGWPHARLRLAVIGQPREEKDVRLVLDAVEACRRPDVQLVVRATPGTGSADSRVIVDYGHLPERRFRRRMRAFDAVVMPFTSEGMLATGTVFDCIGAGVPAIICEWGYLREVLGEAGIRFGSTVAELTACVDGMSESALARARRATLALRDRYRWSDIGARTLAAFEEL
jgi:glycosyltransferase involved in cell wall biosynthesis